MLQGYYLIHPMGWMNGLPAENYAIKMGTILKLLAAD